MVGSLCSGFASTHFTTGDNDPSGREADLLPNLVDGPVSPIQRRKDVGATGISFGGQPLSVPYMRLCQECSDAGSAIRQALERQGGSDLEASDGASWVGPVAVVLECGRNAGGCG
jgi:hypothetical protein